MWVKSSPSRKRTIRGVAVEGIGPGAAQKGSTFSTGAIVEKIQSAGDLEGVGVRELEVGVGMGRHSGAADHGSNASGILAIIPARGGSKGIERKNIRVVGGKPLLAHSIEHAW